MKPVEIVIKVFGREEKWTGLLFVSGYILVKNGIKLNMLKKVVHAQ